MSRPKYMMTLNLDDIDNPLSRYSVLEPIEEDIKYPIEAVVRHLLEWNGMPLDTSCTAPH